MLERKNLMQRLLLSLVSAFVLTRLFPFLFGSQIYSGRQGWRLLAPSSLLLGPSSMVTTLDRAISLCIDTLAFGAIIFAAWQGVCWAKRYKRDG